MILYVCTHVLHSTWVKYSSPVFKSVKVIFLVDKNQMLCKASINFVIWHWNTIFRRKKPVMNGVQNGSDTSESKTSSPSLTPPKKRAAAIARAAELEEENTLNVS